MPFCPRSSVRLERHRAKVEVASAIPAVDAILPLCLSSHRTSFVNSYSSVRVRPEAPSFAWNPSNREGFVLHDGIFSETLRERFAVIFVRCEVGRNGFWQI